MFFQEETSYTTKAFIEENNIAILPVGAVEAHGPHLPLGTDNYLAEEVSKKVASQTNAFVLPTLPYGQVWSLKNFPGSINVSNESLISMIADIGESLARQGVKAFVLMNGHLGNQNALKDAARVLFEKEPELKVYYFFYPGMNDVVNEVKETSKVHGSYFHACEIETSYMLYLKKDKVDMSKAINDTPNIPIEADVTPTPWEEFTNTAVLGDATLASEAKGKYIIDYCVQRMVEILQKEK